MSPGERSSWTDPAVVEGFVRSAPNPALMAYAKAERRRAMRLRVLDIGCGAGRNAVPLADMGCDVLGIDRSWPMLHAASGRLEGRDVRLALAAGAMDALPAADRRFDMIVAHGVWNLARTDAELRRAIREAARVITPDGGLFVFTFSRNTLPPHATPVAGESYVFTQFSGEPQCFLTDRQLYDELAAVGFEPDPQVPLVEHNRRAPGMLSTPAVPVIYEAAFRMTLPGG
jgi:2-polyprenyl-3-methyl-5-hydroxy-6-metoxy-1,4-benzoquinol methylase